MRPILQRLAPLALTVVAALACSGDDGAAPPADALPDADAAAADVAPIDRPDPLLTRAELTGVTADYLAHATADLTATNPVSVMAHLVRADLDPAWAASSFALLPPIPEDSWDHVFAKLADLRDTSDFDAIELVNLLYRFEGHPLVPAALWERVEEALVAFKFWYTQPTRDGVTDDMWYWSENHEVLFHTIEHLVGARFPDRVFPQTGMTGAEHRDHGRAMLRKWMSIRERFGFTEFHSNVYWPHSFRPLVTLAELADDPELATRAAMLCDVMIFDLALHSHRGVYTAPHGRSYKKDKMTGPDASVFNLSKALFAATDHPWRSRADASVVLLAHASRYRLPRVLLDVGRHPGPLLDRERMGLPLDEHEPIGDGDPIGPYGFPYTEDELALWWSMGALSVWQVLPMTLEVVERYDLWESELFQGFSALKPFASLDRASLQSLARDFAHMAAVGLLTEVDTVIYRTPDYALASAQDYRKGSRATQLHSWQATLDTHALVFTTHPGEPPRASTNWREDGQPGSWTGTASQPRTAQHDNVAIHLYAPQYVPMGPPLDGFSAYEPYTHAYFPQDHFDEVVRSGHWTFGRKGDGYLGLWSWRAPEWVALDPEVTATNGMVEPFTLRAPGGPHNVWIVELGRAADDGDFAAFMGALEAAPITVSEVTEGLPDHVLPPVFDVSYGSPSVGALSFGWEGPLRVAGEPVPIGGYRRFDNPWSQAELDGGVVVIADPQTGAGVRLDFDAVTRTPLP